MRNVFNLDNFDGDQFIVQLNPAEWIVTVESGRAIFQRREEPLPPTSTHHFRSPRLSRWTSGSPQWGKLEPDSELADFWPPSEDDIFIYDAGSGYKAFYTGSVLASGFNWEDLISKINSWMNTNQFWPNVWYINERGNTTLLRMPSGEFGPGVV